MMKCLLIGFIYGVKKLPPEKSINFFFDKNSTHQIIHSCAFFSQNMWFEYYTCLHIIIALALNLKFKLQTHLFLTEYIAHSLKINLIK